MIEIIGIIVGLLALLPKSPIIRIRMTFTALNCWKVEEDNEFIDNIFEQIANRFFGTGKIKSFFTVLKGKKILIIKWISLYFDPELKDKQYIKG